MFIAYQPHDIYMNNVNLRIGLFIINTDHV